MKPFITVLTMIILFIMELLGAIVYWVKLMISSDDLNAELYKNEIAFCREKLKAWEKATKEL